MKKRWHKFHPKSTYKSQSDSSRNRPPDSNPRDTMLGRIFVHAPGAIKFVASNLGLRLITRKVRQSLANQHAIILIEELRIEGAGLCCNRVCVVFITRCSSPNARYSDRAGESKQDSSPNVKKPATNKVCLDLPASHTRCLSSTFASALSE